MIVKVKYDISQQLAKDRIEQLLLNTVQKHQALISSHEFSWNDYSCNVKLSAMHMQFKGSVVVGKGDVQVDLSIPMIFYSYRAKIQTIIEDELNKILK